MAEVLSKNQICENCGADVRLNALFCYNCGSQVVPDELLEAEENDDRVSNAWFKESITEPKLEAIPKPKSKPIKEQKIVDKSGEELTPLSLETTPVETNSKSVETEIKPEKNETKSLKTASSLRQKQKLPPKRKVEVTWEAPQSAPNIWFLVVAFILLLVAIGLIVAMLYIR